MLARQRQTGLEAFGERCDVRGDGDDDSEHDVADDHD